MGVKNTLTKVATPAKNKKAAEKKSQSPKNDKANSGYRGKSTEEKKKKRGLKEKKAPGNAGQNNKEKKKPTLEQVALQQTQLKSASDYLHTWQSKKAEWNFNKTTQTWIAHRMFSTTQLPDDLFTIAVAYFNESRGKVRLHLMNSSTRHLKNIQKKSGNVSPDDSKIVERANRVKKMNPKDPAVPVKAKTVEKKTTENKAAKPAAKTGKKAAAKGKKVKPEPKPESDGDDAVEGSDDSD